MKKKFLIVPLSMALSFVVPFGGQVSAHQDEMTVASNAIEICSNVASDSIKESEIIKEAIRQAEIEQELAARAERYRLKMEELETTVDKYTWYLEFKTEFIDDAEDAPETIYDYFTEDELNTLFGVVEAEVGVLGGFDERCNVASVIFNRMDSESFADALKDLLTARQFSTISNGRYKKVEVTPETIAACEFVFCIGDTTNGALFFESGNSNVHDSYATYMFTDGAGHKFYK